MAPVWVWEQTMMGDSESVGDSEEEPMGALEVIAWAAAQETKSGSALVWSSELLWAFVIAVQLEKELKLDAWGFLSDQLSVSMLVSLFAFWLEKGFQVDQSDFSLVPLWG